MAGTRSKKSGTNAPAVVSLSAEATAGAPLRAQLFVQLRDQILSGALAYNAVIPSARTMAATLGVSRNTVETALRRLVDEGLIARRTGAGTMVVYLRPAPGAADPGETSLPSNAMTVTQRYAPRQLHFAHLRRTATHVLKVYTLGIGDQQPMPASVAAAELVAGEYLAVPHDQAPVAGIDWWGLPSHGVGVLVVHRGRDAIVAVLDVWVDSSMLRHHAWVARLSAATQFVSIASTDIGPGVWELAVVQHERAAWLRHVLREHGQPDLDAYLADVLTGDV